jgi:hypothetical protein
VMVEETERGAGADDVGSSRRCTRASTSAGARPTSRRPGRAQRGRRADAEPHRRARRRRRHGRRGLRAAADRDPVDGQRDRRAGQPLGPDRSTTSTVHARRRSSTRTAARR